MADIRSTAAEIRRGKKKKKERKKLQGKNIMAPLLHRAAIITNSASPKVVVCGSLVASPTSINPRKDGHLSKTFVCDLKCRQQ